MNPLGPRVLPSPRAVAEELRDGHLIDETGVPNTCVATSVAVTTGSDEHSAVFWSIVEGGPPR
jgi:hypothetical protein